MTKPSKSPLRRLLGLAIVSAPLLLGACGTTEEHRTVVVNAPPGSTVVVPDRH